MSPSAEALLEFNDGRDKLNVTAEYGISYDSNLFAYAGGAGDFGQSLSLGINYTRRAGLIGVSGSIGVSTERFDKYTGEDFTDPTFQLEFSKDRGRLPAPSASALNARAAAMSPSMNGPTRGIMVARSDSAIRSTTATSSAAKAIQPPGLSQNTLALQSFLLLGSGGRLLHLHLQA